MSKLLKLKSLLPLVLAGSVLLSAGPSYASEVMTPAIRARASHIKVHSINHQFDWARGLVYIYPTSGGTLKFYAASDPQMFELLMTAIKIDATIYIKYESTTSFVTSIEFTS